MQTFKAVILIFRLLSPFTIFNCPYATSLALPYHPLLPLFHVLLLRILPSTVFFPFDTFLHLQEQQKPEGKIEGRHTLWNLSREPKSSSVSVKDDLRVMLPKWCHNCQGPPKAVPTPSPILCSTHLRLPNARGGGSKDHSEKHCFKGVMFVCLSCCQYQNLFQDSSARLLNISVPCWRMCWYLQNVNSKPLNYSGSKTFWIPILWMNCKFLRVTISKLSLVILQHFIHVYVCWNVHLLEIKYHKCAAKDCPWKCMF